MQLNELLIYSTKESARLKYVLDCLFKDFKKLKYKLTFIKSEAESHKGPLINYSTDKIDHAINILPHKLLFEEGVSPQQMNINRWKKSFVIFYNNPSGKVPFDLFAASFYMLSRYEEYLPHKKDKHKRFPASASLAKKYSFLDTPIVDIWLKHLIRMITHKFQVTIPKEPLRFDVTFDVDLIWKYKHKSFIRTALGTAKDIMYLKFSSLKERKKVLAGEQEDPFYCFDKIDAALKGLQVKSKYFFLVPLNHSKYERITLLSNPVTEEVVKQLNEQRKIHIHPSYYAQEHNTFMEEKKQLERILDVEITKTRQHYMRFSLPEYYQKLIKLEMTDDYSMGFPDENGFRAGTNHAFMWYDLAQEKETLLRVHPFAYMDSTSFFHKKHTQAEAWMELYQLIQQSAASGGTFTTVWHNYILGDQLVNENYWQLFDSFIRLLEESTTFEMS